jgi:hypothetical protein
MRRSKLLACIVAIVWGSLASAGAFAQRQAAKSTCDPDLIERLEIYFSRSEVGARQIVNADFGPGPLKVGTEKIDIGGVAVEFLYRESGGFSVDVSMKINGHTIVLNDQKSINLAHDDQPIEPNLVNKWNQIRLYELGDDRKVIAISFIPEICTGLMCSVSGRLYFQLGTMTASFFGAYRTDSDPKLYQFAGGSGPFVVATNFTGDPHGVTSSSAITYELYRLEDNGQFTGQRDKRGRKYFIKHSEPPTDSPKPGALESNWIEDIKHLKQ